MNDFNSSYRKAQADRIHSRLYPNGEFTCGVVPCEKKSQREVSYDALHQLQYVTIEEYVCYRNEKVEKQIWKPFDMVLDEASSIGLSHPAICHKAESTQTRARRGSKGISSYQRRIIRNGAWLLQQKYSKKRLGFLTLTLPTLKQWEVEILLTNKRGWSDLVRKVTQEMQRELERQGKPTQYIGCTEIQGRRFARTGIVAPHLHLIYVAHDGDYRYYLEANWLRKIWRRLLQNAIDECGLKSEVDTEASVDCKTIKKDAGKYIGKYMSKGGKVIEQIKESGNGALLPTNWAHCAKKLKKYILNSMDTLTDDEKRAIFNGYDLEAEGYLEWLMAIDVEINGEVQRMGYCGRLSQPRHIIVEEKWCSTL